MRQRAGFIIFITGVVLLWKPNFNIEQIIMSLNYLLANYWPIVMVLAGIYMLMPVKKRRKSKPHQ